MSNIPKQDDFFDDDLTDDIDVSVENTNMNSPDAIRTKEKLALLKLADIALFPNSLDASRVNLIRLQYGIDKGLSTVEEKERLKFNTQLYNASATVEIPPLDEGVCIQIGWVQVCTEMKNLAFYGENGIASWEFLDLVDGKYKMISDAGPERYPWYNVGNELMCLQGPTTTPTVEEIKMIDTLSTSVSWYIPAVGYKKERELTFYYRKQHFYSFLVFKDSKEKKFEILKVISWLMEVAIDVDPQKPLGERSEVLGVCEQESPKSLPQHLWPVLEPHSLKPPRANECQVLVWRPLYADARLLTKPSVIRTPLLQYVRNTRDLLTEYMLFSKKNYLINQKNKILKNDNNNGKDEDE